jgi:hypothetical protein
VFGFCVILKFCKFKLSEFHAFRLNVPASLEAEAGIVRHDFLLLKPYLFATHKHFISLEEKASLIIYTISRYKSGNISFYSIGQLEFYQNIHPILCK